MKTIITKMNPEDEAEYIFMKTLAPKSVILLAMELQRSAFPCSQDLESDFQPRPIYLRQAFSLWENLPTRKRIMAAIEGLKS